MTLDKDDFVSKVSFVSDESEIDALCVQWLELLALDYHGGKEGEVAKALLEQVKKLLDINQ
ncbi:MAG: hypothetical protein EPN21_07930 [Methylococcaceae bacterium]|nr:MAG: hypothetical protein EPN21_07930 [Methylococcaceae bacterium]